MKTLVQSIKVIKGPFKNYSYLIIEENTLDTVLIDPAWEIDKIDYYLHKYGCKVRAILLTHYHYDHVNLAAFYNQKYDASIYISREDFKMCGLKSKNVKYLDGNLQFGSIDVEVIKTPGHSQGSVCYRLNNDVFTGDTLFIEGCGTCISDDYSGPVISDHYLRYNSPIT